MCCQKSKWLYGQNLCEGCWYITGAENTREQYGATQEKITVHQRGLRVVEYNQFRKQGLTSKQIAAIWGISINGVNRFRKRATDAGLKLERWHQPENWSPENRKGRLPVPHGGGKAGRRDCKCEPCKQKRREYGRKYYRGKVNKEGDSS